MLLRTRWNLSISNLIYSLGPEKLFFFFLSLPCIDCFGHRQAAFYLSNSPGVSYSSVSLWITVRLCILILVVHPCLLRTEWKGNQKKFQRRVRLPVDLFLGEKKNHKESQCAHSKIFLLNEIVRCCVISYRSICITAYVYSIWKSHVGVCLLNKVLIFFSSSGDGFLNTVFIIHLYLHLY